MRGNRIWLWLAIALIALVGAFYAYIHAPLPDDDELQIVALDPADPDRTKIGELTYLGGIDIPRMGQNIGGLSGLRWDAQSQRLLAITDDARWVWLSLGEQDGRLVGLDEVESGPLLGLEGEILTGKTMGDSESLTRSANGGWLVGFERTHRIWRYPSLDTRPVPTSTDVEAEFGTLDDNDGLETLAGNERSQLMCVQRMASSDRPNCLLRDMETGYSDFPVVSPQELVGLGAVPTDADALADGTFLILFRSYSPTEGNSAAIVAYSPDGARREIATLQPPLTTDNFEGLAVREEGDDTFLYIVSDDNFSGRQRTLLMKFKLNSSHQSGPAENSP